MATVSRETRRRIRELQADSDRSTESIVDLSDDELRALVQREGPRTTLAEFFRERTERVVRDQWDPTLLATTRSEPDVYCGRCGAQFCGMYRRGLYTIHACERLAAGDFFDWPQDRPPMISAVPMPDGPPEFKPGEWFWGGD